MILELGVVEANQSFFEAVSDSMSQKNGGPRAMTSDSNEIGIGDIYTLLLGTLGAKKS